MAKFTFPFIFANVILVSAVFVAICTALSSAISHGAVIIYSDDFSGSSSGDLNGTTPDIGPAGATWQSTPGAWNADASLALAPTQGYSALLPFVPVEGKRYALSVDSNPTAGGAGFDFGFNEPDHQLDTWFALAAQGPYAWFFRWVNGNVSAIRGPAWESQGDYANVLGPVNLKVVLDTTNPTLWTAEWFVDGVSVRGPTDLPMQATVGIGTIGFSAHQGVTAGSVDNFMLVDLDAVAPAVPGDFDGDGDVDGADFVAWQTNFPKATGATLAEGDADSDGDVDGADFVVWQTNFPFTPGGGVTTVPEPKSIMLIISGIAGLMVWLGRAKFTRRKAVTT